MKGLIIGIFLISLSFGVFAKNYDGCYILHQGDTIYPSICLSGTNEEGIGGANARMAMFRTNSTRLLKCIKSDAIQISKNRFVFKIRSRDELVITNLKEDRDGVLSGKAEIGSTKLTIFKLAREFSWKLINEAAVNDCI